MFWIVTTIISASLAVAYLGIATLDPFPMSDDRRRKFHGAGLGLVACAGLSLAHFFVQGR